MREREDSDMRESLQSMNGVTSGNRFHEKKSLTHYMGIYIYIYIERERERERREGYKRRTGKLKRRVTVIKKERK